MTREQVVAKILDRVPWAVLGKTMARCPDGLDWEKSSDEDPVQFRAVGPRGGRHFIGVATQVKSEIVSYGLNGIA